MNIRHPHYDTIVAWAEGKPIQYLCPQTYAWLDWDLDGMAPLFHPDREYRVKPVTIRYRVYLRKHSLYNERRYVEIVTEADNEKERVEEGSQFVRWLGDWQEVEI